MSTTEPTDEQVEAAARAIAKESGHGNGLGLCWRQHIREARAALRAALSVAPPSRSDFAPDEDREPQPGDGPDYHAEHAAWAARRLAPDEDEREALDAATIYTSEWGAVVRKSAVLDWLARRSPVPPSAPTPEFDGDTSPQALAAWERYCTLPKNDVPLTAAQQVQDAFTAGYDAARRSPTPDVDTAALIEELESKAKFFERSAPDVPHTGILLRKAAAALRRTSPPEEDNRD